MDIKINFCDASNLVMLLDDNETQERLFNIWNDSFVDNILKIKDKLKLQLTDSLKEK